ncbi:MAG TPA: ABC transporter permease [Bryobacteraceae bacterium]
MISLKSLWRNLFRGAEFERNLSDELAFYADLLTQEKISRGMSATDARREALVEIGGIEQVKEEVRDVRAGSSWDGVFKDVRQSVRSLWHSRGWTALAIGTLGIGLGATILIFSIFYGILLQPMPFRNPGRLVQLWEARAAKGWDQAGFSRPNFWDVRARSTAFESMGAMVGSNMNLTGSGNPEHLSAAVVSAQFFHVLGVTPILGRDFGPLQDQPGHNHDVVLLSSRFWQSRFAGSRKVLGTKLHLDNHAYTVIGVLPNGEPWLNAGDVFVPMVYDPKEDDRGNFEATVIGRLAPGVTISAARAELQSIAQGLSKTYREDRGMGVRVAQSEIWRADASLRRALWVLLGAVSLLLLIACVNIANLLLAKASARSRELCLRQALGASRHRIIRLVLSESLLLGFLGAALGLMITEWGLAAIRFAGLSGIPNAANIHVNGWVLGFALAVTVLSGTISGLMPAIQFSSGNIAAALRESDRTQTASRTQNRGRTVLVAVEVALSMILLIGASLLMRSFGKLLSVNRGFATANRVIATVNIPLNYDDARAATITGTLLERVRALPGVHAAGTVNSTPIVGWDPGMGFGAEDSAQTVDGKVPWASWRFISTGYLHSMGIPLLKGRQFVDSDFDRQKVRRVIVSQSIVNLLWPGKDPIGRHIILWKGQGNDAAEVIGVAGNTRDHGLAQDPTRIVYIPFVGQTNSPAQLIVDGTLSPAQVASSLRSILASIDPQIPVSGVETMGELVRSTLGSKRLDAALLSTFALIALLLSMTGIYGVLSYSVARRTAEIGIRVALGADRIAILSLIVREGMQPILIGIAIGLAGSLAITRLMAGLLFEVKPFDIASYATVTVLIVTTALIACWLPARRALRVDPAAALREA